MASASWLSKVERFFRDLTVNPVRRRVFTSVPDLVGGIDEYLIEHNGRVVAAMKEPVGYQGPHNRDSVYGKRRGIDGKLPT